MLCLSLVGVLTMAYNGLGGRLMFKVENSSLYTSSSLAPVIFAAASKILSEHRALIMPSEFKKRRITFNSN